jgi:hypothetical protein
MDEALQGYLAALRNEVEAAGLSEGARQSILWGLGRLPALYAQFRLSSESRHGDEITRLVHGVLKGLVESRPPCPAAHRLAADIPERLRLLHEQAGLPGLALKTPRAPSPRSRKVGSR